MHSYNKHITIIDIRNFMHSYHGLIQVLMLITELNRIQTYTYNKLMFIRDSRRSYRACSYSELILITDLCLFGTPVGVTEFIRIQKYP